ncbi:hypothetical protein K458DRAFT_424115 [Lentithecium fluviatile CBS 122367]|uniref:Uncharacterized protein n=1 Tax=Lentithecium fluviatile CBS 122367 TaxID=1168545 RepID=A0A6G1IGZ5_9PLEO|nr:hypothetical protein K458DRAFT_424115 [Lentithecium fluviatile CBS 122367]
MAFPEISCSKLDNFDTISLHPSITFDIPSTTKRPLPIRSQPTNLPSNHLAMKDLSQPIHPRDLTSRLARIKKSHSLPNNGDALSRLPGVSRVGTTSSTSSSDSFPRLPVFSKSTTMSTTTSGEFSRPEDTGTEPTAKGHGHSVEVGQEQFSKPRAGERRKRKSNESAKNVPEFQYYGRHANTWLFNDFSITDSVKKGWGKLLSGKNDE